MKICGKENCNLPAWEDGCISKNFCALHCRCTRDNAYLELFRADEVRRIVARRRNNRYYEIDTY